MRFGRLSWASDHWDDDDRDDEWDDDDFDDE